MVGQPYIHVHTPSPHCAPSPAGHSQLFMGGGDVNYVHEDEIWRQRLKTEVEVASQWGDNWGFLTGREQPEPRGFSQKVAKYSYAGGKWTVKQVRVPDDTQEGIDAAESEQTARHKMTDLKWNTKPVAPVQPCETKARAEPAPPHRCLGAHTAQHSRDRATDWTIACSSMLSPLGSFTCRA